MNKPNDGGPAFPVLDTIYERDQPDAPLSQYQQTRGGLSIRDYFAGQALAGMLAGDFEGPDGQLACSAYQIADTMLAEREKEPLT